MPTPPKPVMVLKNEKKSHRTKSELNLREKGEKALESGVALKEKPEVKKNIVAHKEFLRISKLLTNIQKNDALYENIVNRYALLYAECLDFEEKREVFYNNIRLLEERFEHQSDEDLTLSEYYKLQSQMQKQIIELDKQVQAKRKMMLDIEKENVMTISSALRSIPKRQGGDEDDPLLRVLGRG